MTGVEPGFLGIVFGRPFDESVPAGHRAGSDYLPPGDRFGRNLDLVARQACAVASG